MTDSASRRVRKKSVKQSSRLSSLYRFEPKRQATGAARPVKIGFPYADGHGSQDRRTGLSNQQMHAFLRCHPVGYGGKVGRQPYYGMVMGVRGGTGPRAIVGAAFVTSPVSHGRHQDPCEYVHHYSTTGQRDGQPGPAQMPKRQTSTIPACLASRDARLVKGLWIMDVSSVIVSDMSGPTAQWHISQTRRATSVSKFPIGYGSFSGAHCCREPVAYSFGLY